jgi:hypothetical protein
LNAGVSGYGVDQEYLYTKRITDIYRPDLVILNLHENDIHDSNDNCLFSASTSQKYQQVPGALSNIYVQYLALGIVPNSIRMSKSFNLIFASLSPDNNRTNFRCSLAASENVEDAMLQKIVFLVSSLKTELAPETELLLTMVPFQHYFMAENSNLAQPLINKDLILNRLQKIGVVDGNQALSMYYPALAARRIMSDLRVAGTQTELIGDQTASSSATTDPSQELFLGTLEEPDSPLGFRHLSPKGSYLFATVVADEIIRNNPVPKKSEN